MFYSRWTFDVDLLKETTVEISRSDLIKVLRATADCLEDNVSSDLMEFQTLRISRNGQDYHYESHSAEVEEKSTDFSDQDYSIYDHIQAYDDGDDSFFSDLEDSRIRD